MVEEEVILFIRVELDEAVGRGRNKKVPGPDGVGPEVIRAICNAFPDLVLHLMNRLLIVEDMLIHKKRRSWSH